MKKKPVDESLAYRLMRHLNDKHQCSISLRVADSAVEFMKRSQKKRK